MGAYFYLISGISGAMLFGFALLTRNIPYHAPDTDNEQLAYAAAKLKPWHWPSDIHKYIDWKTTSREVTVFFMFILQNIFRDYESDYPYTFLAGLSIAVNTILTFLILEKLFNPQAAFFASIFYLISFWPWHMAISAGHSLVATMVFMVATYILMLTIGYPAYIYILVLAAGFLLCCSQFASSSATKLIPAFLALLVFLSNYDIFKAGNYSELISQPHFISQWPYALMLASLWTLIISISYVFVPKIVSIIYHKKGPDILNRIISGQEFFPLKHFISNGYKKFKTIANITGWFTLIVALLILMVKIDILLVCSLGFLAGFLFFTLPNIKVNAIRYFKYLSQNKTHFRVYRNHYAAKGIAVDRYTRGSGIKWVPQIFWLFAPFHIFLLYAGLLGGLLFLPKLTVVLIAAVALSPVIWAELSKSVQVARVYSPSMAIVSVFFAYILSNIPAIHWTSYTIFLVIALIWNAKQFFGDILPARMTVKYFLEAVKKYGITDIYTYDTSFNISFAKNVPGIAVSEYVPAKKPTPQSPYKIHYINSISEVKDGWIAIPGTSGKAVNMPSYPESIDDDFDKDPLLSKIIINRSIEKIAEKKFKTYGTSTYWINEDDIASYRSLELKEISVHDLWRGYAWLLHSSKLKSLITEYGR